MANDMGKADLKAAESAGEEAMKLFSGALDLFSKAMAAEASGKFAEGFVRTIYYIGRFCWHMAYWLLKQFFGTIKRTLKTLGTICVKALECMGNPAYALAHAIADVLVCVLSVLIDAEELTTMPH